MSAVAIVASAVTESASLIRRTQTGPPDHLNTPTWETSGEPVTVTVPMPITVEELTARPGSKATARCFALDVPAGPFDQLTYTDPAHGKWELDGPPKRWTWPWGDGGSYIEMYLVEVT